MKKTIQGVKPIKESIKDTKKHSKMLDNDAVMAHCFLIKKIDTTQQANNALLTHIKISNIAPTSLQPTTVDDDIL